MISERTLKKWRKEAIKVKADKVKSDKVADPLELKDVHACWIDKIQDRILDMTQELLDQHLIRK